jgi:hypothetical protein
VRDDYFILKNYLEKKGISSTAEIVADIQSDVNRNKDSIKERLKKYIAKLSPEDWNRIKEEYRVRFLIFC